MDTLTAITSGEVVMPIPIQIMFGGCPVDPDMLEVFAPEPRWDELFDEKLDARFACL
ncbi:MAG TPA: hypothetical protein VFA34_05940 [Actinomycetota bacterium]|jgi:hypothetical protein|nr:hypothetical protein [Actinomycetota bacterium]